MGIIIQAAYAHGGHFHLDWAHLYGTICKIFPIFATVR